VRNLFDQYDQPENRLTHALVCTLQSDRYLIRPFLHRLGARGMPPTHKIHIVEQQVPGEPVSGNENESKGLPDACFYDNNGWAVLIESKINAGISVKQLVRHADTAKRCDFLRPQVALISVDRPMGLPKGLRHVEWRQLYEWFNGHAGHSWWAQQFVEYMRVFESRMTVEDYEIRGTITMFDGLRFDQENPYTYNEAKRLIRLLGDELQKRKDLGKLGVDPKGKRRTAITGRIQDSIWDFLPLRIASHAHNFTEFPHLTFSLTRRHAVAATTVPNGVKGGFRTKLRDVGHDGFRELITDMEERLRPIVRRTNAKPIIYALQRHYPSQRSPAETDARLDADIRTVIRGSRSQVKYQPQWTDAIYQVLCHKRSNIQLGLEVRFSYTCKEIRSTKAVGLFAETWKAMAPLLAFASKTD